MAKAKKPTPTFTTAEQKKAVEFIRKQLGGFLLKRFNELDEAQQLKYADKFLKRHAKRNKAGAVDWESLKDFIKFIFELLLPLFSKKKNA